MLPLAAYYRNHLFTSTVSRTGHNLLRKHIGKETELILSVHILSMPVALIYSEEH